MNTLTSYHRQADGAATAGCFEMDDVALRDRLGFFVDPAGLEPHSDCDCWTLEDFDDIIPPNRQAR